MRKSEDNVKLAFYIYLKNWKTKYLLWGSPRHRYWTSFIHL